MKIILTRHGETEENVKGICQGQSIPGKLTPKGIKQAKQLALRLKDEKIDVIYSSDLARAADTAKEIAKFHPNTEFIVTEKLREKNRGEFEGMTKKERGLENWPKDKLFPQPKNGETNDELIKRAKSQIDEAYEKHNEETVLFVTHGGTKIAIVSVITGLTFMEVVNKGHLSNTSLSIFEIDEDRNHKIHCYNCTKHLEQNT